MKDTQTMTSTLLKGRKITCQMVHDLRNQSSYLTLIAISFLLSRMVYVSDECYLTKYPVATSRWIQFSVHKF